MYYYYACVHVLSLFQVKVSRTLLELQYQIKWYKIGQDTKKWTQQSHKLPTFQTQAVPESATRLTAGHLQAQRFITEDSPKSRAKKEAEVC